MKKLLIVDDNEQNLYMLQVLLSANGFQVEQALNGAEALEHARRAPPDMIISDILMPVMDGYALCRAWKEEKRLKNIPFVFYSATYTDPKDQEFALNLGADRFILKPTEPDKFLAMILETEKDYEAGKFVSARQPIEAAVYYKEYNAALVRKLEAKLLQLEEVNRVLEQDITGRKQGEEARREKMMLLENAHELARLGSYTIDLPSQTIFLSPEMARLYGAGDKAISLPLEEYRKRFYHPNYIEHSSKLADDTYRSGQPLSIESQVVRADGSTIWVQGRSHVLANGTTVLGMVQDITERKIAEENMQMLGKTIDVASDGVYWLDIDGRFVFANISGCRRLGYTHDELLTMHIGDISPKGTPELWPKLWTKIKNEKIYLSESVHRRKDGSLFPVEISSTYVKFGDKEYINGFARDITERKRTEENLRQSESRLNLALEKTNTGAWELNLEDHTAYRTLGHARIFGYDTLDQSWSYEKLLEHILVEDRPNVAQSLKSVIKGQSDSDIEYRIRRADGVVRWIRGTAGLGRDSKGKPTTVVGLVQDITEKKQVEERLRESEEKYRTLVDGASEGILVAQAGMLKFVNHQAVEFSGYPETELLEKPFSDFIHPDDHQLIADYYKKRLNGEPAPSRYAFRMLNPDESIRWVENSSVLIDWNGMPATLNFLNDITERKRLEKEKEQLQAQFLQAQKMEAIGTLAGGVAHDFNNLLTAISGFTTLAMGKIDESSPMQRDLMQVSKAATRAAGLTRQLLLFSRKQHMEPMPLDLNSTVSHLVKMLGRLIGENIIIETSLEREPWCILGDEGNVEQVLMNLSVNARDAMPDGGKIFIKTENVTTDDEYCRTNKMAHPGRFICLSVSDTGTGMTQAIKEHIFEPFFTTKGAGKGTGLGLSVVFGIMQQHNGWVNVYSEIGHGTTFKVYFPSTDDASGTKIKEETPSASLEGNCERIVVVEDQAEVRDLATQMLTTNGYCVFPVPSAKEALALFEKEDGKFDLVFSDVVLTDTTGILLVEELLRRWKFKVIITSGYTDEKANWDFIKEKNFRFLHKPYSIRDLLQAVRDVLGKGGKVVK